MLQNPAAGNQALFNLAWLKNAFLDIRPRTLNVYIHVRPRELAEEGIGQHRDSRVGIDAANNKYLLDGYHHKMSLSERWTAIRNLRRHWLSVPGVQMVRVGYERFGMHDALEYFQERMR